MTAISYNVTIRENATGIVRSVNMTLPWYDHSHFFWTEGNFGCDCNRAIVFHDWSNEEYDDLCDKDEQPDLCGDTRYTVLHADFPDGSRVIIDDPVHGRWPGNRSDDAVLPRLAGPVFPSFGIGAIEG